MARVAVVIPNWNGQPWLGPCLEALRRQDYADFTTIIVDNGSQDGSVAYLRENFPEVEVCGLAQNIGFAAGMNAGIRKVGTCEYVAALNNDTEADPNWLSSLVATLDAVPQAGSAASLMLSMADPSVIDTAGDGYSWTGLSFKLGAGRPRSCLPDAPFPVLGASAGACLYRGRMLAEVGLFDESYFAYMEDIDLALRAQMAGWICMSVPKSIVRHAGAASSGGGPSAFSVRLSTRNLFVTIFKNAPIPLLLIMLIFTIVFQVAAIGATLVTGRPAWLARTRRAWVEGIWAAMRAAPAALSGRRATRPIRRLGSLGFARMLMTASRQRARYRSARA